MGHCCLEGKSPCLGLEYNNSGVPGLRHENLGHQGLKVDGILKLWGQQVGGCGSGCWFPTFLQTNNR